jgi:glucose uptake protein GlcU
MKKLRFSATITAVLGFFAVLSIVFLFMTFSDFADPDARTTEWYIAGICLIILSAFTLAVFVTLSYLLKTSDKLINLTTDTGINK